jgi:hypothetical protein
MAQAPSPARFAHDLSPLGKGGPAAPSFTSPDEVGCLRLRHSGLIDSGAPESIWREAGPKGRVSGFGARRSTIRVWTLI